MQNGVRLSAILLCGLIASCDEENKGAQSLGGGPGSSDPANVEANGNGFCDPSQSLGDPSLVSQPTSARIDSDGNPLAQGQDPSWNPLTSGSVNGQPVSAAQYNYAVLSRLDVLDPHFFLRFRLRNAWSSNACSAVGFLCGTAFLYSLNHALTA